MQATQIEFYDWPTPNGLKISIALEEMHLSYQTNFVNIMHGDQLLPQFISISPNNKIPVIIDHDGPGGRPIVVFESGAILQYLGQRYGHFYPKNGRSHVLVNEWLFWMNANLGPMAGQKIFFTMLDEKIPAALDYFTKCVDRLHGVLDHQLSETDYLAGGRYSIADMAIFPWVKKPDSLKGEWDWGLWNKLATNQGVDMLTLDLVDIQKYPHVAAWRERIMSRPGTIRAQAHLKKSFNAFIAEH